MDPDFESDPFFTNAEFCWMLHAPGSIPPVRDQGRANACFGFPIVSSVYAEYAINRSHKEKLPLGSAQELMDNLVSVYPPKAEWSQHYNVNTLGSPNSLPNAFRYIKEKGMYTEKQYPYEGSRKPFKEPSHNPEAKIFIKDYRYVNCRNKEAVIARLRKQPLACGVLFGQSLANWGPNQGVYQGLNEEELKLLENEEDKSLVQRHALLMVGYGNEDDLDYYMCQGSYGKLWCHKGYIKIRSDLISNIWYPMNTVAKYKS